MELLEFFRGHPRAAIAFSGGVDSSYLLYAAIQAGARVHAYYVKTAFQPQFELADARRLADEIGARLVVLPVNILYRENILCNSPERCYHCKRMIFEAISHAAIEDGYTLLLDGTNASDDEADRPGTQALRELRVRSPLRECGLTKEEIRRRSKEAGLFTWNKAAYSCLATRIPTGTTITEALLGKTERAEDALARLGFFDYRVRYAKGAAKIELRAQDMRKAVDLREQIVQALREDYEGVYLDLEARG